MENKEFQKTVLENFTELREGQVSLKERFDRSEERTIELFTKLNEKIDFVYEKMMEGFQKVADQFDRINGRLDKTDRLEKRLDDLESEIRELRNKLSQ